MLTKIESILAASESKETFFVRIEKLYSTYSREYRFIERAYDDAENAFAQIKRDGGEPYFVHVRAVAIILIDYLYIFDRTDITIPVHEILAAALLHDVIEDCPKVWTFRRTERDYGRNVTWLLDYVSKRPKSEFNGNTEAQLLFYHNRFGTAPLEFFLIKLADRLHNQLTLWSCDEEKIRRKMLETKTYYIPWARKKGILAQELEATTDNFEEKLKRHLQQCKIA